MAKPGQLLLVDFTFKDSKDSVWNDTYKAGMPAPVMINDSTQLATEIGLMQMFRLLAPGDSVLCSMPIKKFFADMAGGPVPPNVDSTLTMTYYFKVKEIMGVNQYQEMQTKLMMEKEAKQLQLDIAAIGNWSRSAGSSTS